MSESKDYSGLSRLAVISSLALGVGCAGSAAPAASPSNSEGASAPAAGGADAAKPPAETPPPAANGDGKPGTSGGAAAADAAPAQLSLVALCEKGCDKMKAHCSASSVDNCRMNCAQYEHPPEGCDSEVRAALECANSAEDSTCVNIAPEICSPKFRRVVACTNGKPMAAKEESLEHNPPPGWERFKAAGFSSVMPKGVSEGSDGGQPSYSVKEGNLTYAVRVLPPPKEKPTQKNLVGVAMGVLGKCSQKLKLYGMVDRPEKVFIRFDSHCPDGTDWRGAFAINSKKLYMPFVSLPKGAKGEVDAFVYGFELDK